mmetsp:Transcript_91702/g.296717  ORF Transcript_91702/g.296717 Transcript_91702/m.296717 type:complete len:466 (+) Transcript_91702:128-1525(+)
MQLCSCSCTKVASKPAASGRQLVEADVVLYRRLSCCWCASGERRRPLGRTSEDVLERLLRISECVPHEAPDVLRRAAAPVPGGAAGIAGPLQSRASRMLHRLARIAQRAADALQTAGRLKPNSGQAAQGHASSGGQRDLRACAHAACLRRLGWRLLAVGRLLVCGLAVGRLAVGRLLVRGLAIGWLAVGRLAVGRLLAIGWLAKGRLRVRHLPVPGLPIGRLAVAWRSDCLLLDRVAETGVAVGLVQWVAAGAADHRQGAPVLGGRVRGLLQPLGRLLQCRSARVALQGRHESLQDASGWPLPCIFWHALPAVGMLEGHGVRQALGPRPGQEAGLRVHAGLRRDDVPSPRHAAGRQGLQERRLEWPRLGRLLVARLPVGRLRKGRLRIGGLLQSWGLHVRELRRLRAGWLREGLQRLRVLLRHLSRAAAAAAHACQRGGGRRAGAAVPPMGTSWAVAQTKVLGQA